MTAAGSSIRRISACAAAPCGMPQPAAAAPPRPLSMWDRVLDGETRYIKGFKTTADFLLDTSFTYELGLISRLLGIVRRQFTLEGHNAELWDETARRFEHVVPLDLELLPADSMLREFYGSAVK